jgi:hypothetical protein
LASDGGFYFLAQIGVEVWLLRTDMNGDTLWTKKYFGTASSFQQTSDGGFIIGGGIMIIRTYENGVVQWTRVVDAQINSVRQTTDGGFIAVGKTFVSANQDNEDLWLFGLGPENATPVKDDYTALPKEHVLFQNYPNPFNPTTIISWQSAVSSWQTLKIYDVLGNEIATIVDEYKPAGVYEVIFDAGKFSSGVYFYQLRTENFTETKKLILTK